MHRLEIIRLKNPDIYHYPPAAIIEQNTVADITLGDLQGNPFVLLYVAIQQGILWLETPTDYESLVGIYEKDTDALTADDLEQFQTILSRFQQRPCARHRKIRLIGDELSDRGNNDYFMMLVLWRMVTLNIGLTILLSNHGAEFLFYHFTQQLSWAPSVHEKYESAHRSQLALMQLIDKGLVDPQTVKDFVTECYIPHLLPMDYSMDAASGEMILYSHAPTCLRLIRELANHFETPYAETSAQALSETIDQINTKIMKDFKQQVLNARQITHVIDYLIELRFSDYPQVFGKTNEALAGNSYDPYFQPAEPTSAYTLRYVFGHIGYGGSIIRPIMMFNLDNSACGFPLSLEERQTILEQAPELLDLPLFRSSQPTLALDQRRLRQPSLTEAGQTLRQITHTFVIKMKQLMPLEDKRRCARTLQQVDALLKQTHQCETAITAMKTTHAPSFANLTQIMTQNMETYLGENKSLRQIYHYLTFCLTLMTLYARMLHLTNDNGSSPSLTTLKKLLHLSLFLKEEPPSSLLPIIKQTLTYLTYQNISADQGELIIPLIDMLTEEKAIKLHTLMNLYQQLITQLTSKPLIDVLTWAVGLVAAEKRSLPPLGEQASIGVQCALLSLRGVIPLITRPQTVDATDHPDDANWRLGLNILSSLTRLVQNSWDEIHDKVVINYLHTRAFHAAQNSPSLYAAVRITLQQMLPMTEHSSPNDSLKTMTNLAMQIIGQTSILSSTQQQQVIEKTLALLQNPTLEQTTTYQQMIGQIQHTIRCKQFVNKLIMFAGIAGLAISIERLTTHLTWPVSTIPIWTLAGSILISLRIPSIGRRFTATPRTEATLLHQMTGLFHHCQSSIESSHPPPDQIFHHRGWQPSTH